MNKKEFIKGVERLVDPIDVGTLHFMQSINNIIPKKIQKKMVANSGKITPYMGFVVEPYSHFLFYEIENLKKAQGLLPEGFKLRKTKIFGNDELKYYGILGCFKAHTSGFWGMRIEFYIIAEDESTGLLSWVIIDYDTNTITYDPKKILSDPNARHGIMTSDCEGKLYVDIENDHNRKLSFTSDVSKGKWSELDETLWIEGNLSIAYGKDKTDGKSDTFSLMFLPCEFKRGLELSKDDVSMDCNGWFPELLSKNPDKIVCFPYAQHFLSDSPGHSSRTKDSNDLINKIETVDFDQIKVFSTAAFKKAFLLGGIFSALINTTLLILLIMK